MRWPALPAVIAVSLALGGCDNLPFFGKGGAETAVSDTAAAATPAQPRAGQPGQPAQTAQRQPTPPPQPPARDTARRPTRTTPAQPAARTPPTPRRAAARPVRADMPWTPRFTGTIDPGMTVDQVIATWGPPVARSGAGAWTYLYFRNGCEVTCGTFDVVFLQDGQVVDAIVRGQGHTYSGVSSSPPGRPALFTAPGGGIEDVGDG